MYNQPACRETDAISSETTDQRKLNLPGVTRVIKDGNKIWMTSVRLWGVRLIEPTACFGSGWCEAAGRLFGLGTEVKRSHGRAVPGIRSHVLLTWNRRDTGRAGALSWLAVAMKTREEPASLIERRWSRRSIVLRRYTLSRD